MKEARFRSIIANKSYRISFCSAFVICLLTYGYMITNRVLFHDGDSFGFPGGD